MRVHKKKNNPHRIKLKYIVIRIESSCIKIVHLPWMQRSVSLFVTNASVIYINDLSSFVESYSCMFAHDSTLFMGITKYSSALELQEDLN